MGKASRFLPALALFLALSILVGSSSGSSSGLFFHHTVEVEDARSGKRTVELDSQGHIYATFESRLTKLDSGGSILQEHQVLQANWGPCLQVLLALAIEAAEEEVGELRPFFPEAHLPGAHSGGEPRFRWSHH